MAIHQALDQLTEKLKAFEQLQRELAWAGANDSEPRRVFKRCLRKALAGEMFTVPQTIDGWELYDADDLPAGRGDPELAATRLRNATIEICDIVIAVVHPYHELAKLLVKYLD